MKNKNGPRKSQKEFDREKSKKKPELENIKRLRALVNGQVEGKKRVAVVGGGVTGLAAAERLLELRPDWDVELFEAKGRLGGVVETLKQDGFLLELGPDSFITHVPWGLEFCRKIGFEDQLIGTNERFRKAFVVSGAKLHELPPGLMVLTISRVWPLMATPLISVRGKLRACLEVVLPRKKDSRDESLAEFARRRFGREIFERLMQPLASGIYMSDPERLSMQAAFPQYVEMEQKYGSLIRAARTRAAQAKKRAAEKGQDGGPRYSLFVSARDGLSSLITAVSERLTTRGVRLHLNSSVQKLKRTPNGWELHVSGTTTGTEPQQLHFDGIVLAVPAAAAAALTKDVDEQLSQTLAGISSSHCVIVTLAFERQQVQHPLDGFGFVVPLAEGRQVVACTFSSVKYAGRAPEGKVLLRAFMGGACRAEAAEWDDDTLLKTASKELSELLGIHGQPLLTHVQRMKHVMPQYEVGHLDRVAVIEKRLEELPGLQVAGNMFKGVGIPYCIHRGETAAERLTQELDKAKAESASS